MQSKYKVVVGSIVGAIAIHFAFVACGHSISTAGNGPNDAGVDEGLFDALMDRISALIDGTTTDAKADNDSGSDGGACGCAATVSGPIQTTPASENSAQLVTGNLVFGPYTTSGILATGPFILTDATTGYQNGTVAALVIEPTAATCTLPSSSYPDSLPGFLLNVTVTMPLHGARYLVPAGNMLCMMAGSPQENAPEIQWAGFRPYQ
jgi:hypothetical protein